VPKDPQKKAEERVEREKAITINRKARFHYEILEKHEAGLALTGSEVKSCRAHKVSLSDAYARVQGTEIFLVNLDIAMYEKAGYSQHEPKRVRKLLLHRREIKKLIGKVAERGLTLIPLGMHFNERGYVKVSIGLARGRQLFDRRRAIRDRETKRDIARAARRG
jgi:SsrA-binding protein